MRDRECYEAFVGLKDRWRVREVRAYGGSGRVDVWIESAQGMKQTRPECHVTAAGRLTGASWDYS